MTNPTTIVASLEASRALAEVYRMETVFYWVPLMGFDEPQVSLFEHMAGTNESIPAPTLEEVLRVLPYALVLAYEGINDSTYLLQMEDGKLGYDNKLYEDVTATGATRLLARLVQEGHITQEVTP